MDSFDVIILIFFALQFLYGLFQRMKSGANTKDAAQGAIMDALFDQDPPESEGVEYDEYEIVIAHQTAQIDDALIELKALKGRLKALRGQLRAIGGSTTDLLQAVDETLLPKMTDLESRLRTLGAALAEPGEAAIEAYVNNGHVVGEAYTQMTDFQLLTTLIENMVTWRQDRELGPLLADADAIADALLVPLRRYAQVHDVALPLRPPICAPATPGVESILAELLPHQPVIFVPTDFGASIMRWSTIAHQLGHVVWRTLPSVRNDVTNLVGPPRSHTAIKAQGRRIRIDHRAVFSAWMEVVFTDFFAALSLGPAALRGLIHSAGDPDDPINTVTVLPSSHGLGLADTPPTRLRVALMAETLLRMGYTEDVRGLRDLWHELHGTLDVLVMPMDTHRSIEVPLEDFVDLGASLMQTLHLLPFSDLADAPFTAISGLEMTPGVWRRVGVRAQELVDDHVFNDDGRIAVAAAVEAADMKGGLSIRIARGVRRAILGRGETEPRIPDQHYVSPVQKLSDPLTKNEVVESVVLRALFHRKHVRRPQRSVHANPHSMASR